MRNRLIPLAVCVVICSAADALSAEAAGAKPTYRLKNARKPGQIDRVVTRLEVGGNVTRKVDGKEDPAKMSVVCNLTYDEKTLPGPTDGQPGSRSVRYYDQASAVIKVDQVELKAALRPQRRLIAVAIDDRAETLFSPHGPLTRKELELIDVQGNTLLLDRLLPQGPVGIGGSWKHPQKLMAALLGLEAVAESDVQSRLTEVTETAARIEMSGHVEGAIHGVSTEIDLKAKYRFDRRRGRINWFAMALEEKRYGSPVADGVDAVSLVRVEITPQAQSEHLTDAALKGLRLKPSADLDQLTYESADRCWQLTYDRHWNVCGEAKDSTVLRLLGQGKFLAQCNVSTLPKVSPGKQVTLAAFQNDVKEALGDRFGEFVEASQRANEADYREYRVVARGHVSELPIQWNYYLIGDRHGRQAAFAFTVEGDLVSQLANADRELVRSLRFIDPKVASNGKK